MTLVRVVRTYLELRTPETLRSSTSDHPALRLVRESPGNVELFRQLYRDVGATYHWRDRNALTDDELRALLGSPHVQLWVLYEKETPAGFFELCRHADRSVEIAYLGLSAAYFGRGLGKHLLTAAARAAWAFDAERVWLHTCTLDSPAALPNYIARGFEPYRVETYETRVEDPAPAA